MVTEPNVVGFRIFLVMARDLFSVGIERLEFYRNTDLLSERIK